MLSKEEKIKLIQEVSEKHGITSNQFGDNTKISNMTAYNILSGKSKNPRIHNLDIMLNYIEDKIVGSAIPGHKNYNPEYANTIPEETPIYKNMGIEQKLDLILSRQDKMLNLLETQGLIDYIDELMRQLKEKSKS